MRRLHIGIEALLLLALAPFAGCSRRQPSSDQALQSSKDAEVRQSGSVEICALLTPEEIKRITGETPRATTPTHTSGGGFEIYQCLFNLPTYSNSILISVTRRGKGPDSRDPKEFWKEKIEHPAEGEHEKEAENHPEPDQVAGIGEKAVWAGTTVGSALYALKGDVFVRVAVGTFGDEKKRKEKVLEIARLIVKRL